MCVCSGVENEDFDWKNVEPCFYASNRTMNLMTEVLGEEMRRNVTIVPSSMTVNVIRVMESGDYFEYARDP